MASCSRCDSLSPNSSCYVCGDPAAEDDKPYDDHDDIGHDAYTERLLDRADYLRDEMKDRQMEEMWAAQNSED